MKKVLILLLNLIGLTVSAEVITMDLSTATDMASNPVKYSTVFGSGYYDVTDVWDSTYNDGGMHQFIYTNDGHFMLSHLLSLASYGGMSWEGFTLSKVSQDTANVFGCVANGGVAGKGTPYAIGYYSDWVTESLGYSSNIILFDHYYYPEHVYICQNSNTMEAITHGGIFNAKIFDNCDTLSLIISALDSSWQEIESITYYLAVDGKKNNGWEKVSLTTLGKAAGVSFRMTTTDMGSYGANTPMYFALDGLTVNTEHPTNTQDIYTATSTKKRQMIIINSHLTILSEGELYTLFGQRIK